MGTQLSAILKGGRLTATNKKVINFISSIENDRQIAHATILVNEAHLIALTKANIINHNSARKLLKALRKLEKKITFREGYEDIHVMIEQYVTHEVGRVTGGSLHIGKSRNDQVATAIRITLREEMLKLSNQLLSFENSLLKLAKRHTRTVFPGYTHLQPAQPITFAHYLVANGDSILRDEQRVIEAFNRINNSPMGSGALAGTSFNIDRTLVAQLLGFHGLVENSLDAVGSRDFILETLSTCCITALDLSRIVQDIIFYSCTDVGLLEIPDEYSSTSSIMPQKKNPDPLELLRAKCAGVIGNYTTAATTLHALPSGYNLDLQEITILLWRSLDTLRSCIEILNGLVPKLKLKPHAEKQMDLTAATEIANILVRDEKIPFRDAHRLVGRSVNEALAKKRNLKDLKQHDWEEIICRKIKAQTMKNIESALDLKRHIYAYRTIGSPNPNRTDQMINKRTKLIQSCKERNRLIETQLARSLGKLHHIAYYFTRKSPRHRSLMS
jgi:argininosuccinate lyase